MLRFFRRIRQSLIENNNLRRYTLYALGEISLVMIGILLALGINNWNQQRLNTNASKQSLLLLKENIREDITEIKSLKTIADTTLSHLVSLLDQIKRTDEADENVAKYLFQSVLEHTFQSNKRTFEAMNNDGTIAYVKENLLNDILDYYNLLDEISERESISNLYIKNLTEPYIIENYSHLVRYYSGLDALETIYEIDNRELPKLNTEEILNDSKIEILMVARYNQTKQTGDYYEQAIQQATQLISSIKKAASE